MIWSDLATALAVQWAAFAIVMAGAWLVQQRTCNSGWVDVFWTFGLGGIGATVSAIPLDGGSVLERQLLVGGLVALWAMRLGLQILSRTLSTEDDPRYRELAEQWGDRAHRRMFVLLQVQAFASLPLLAAILIAAHRPGSALTSADIFGAAVLLIAIAGEAVADRQLIVFRRVRKPEERVCERGLWRWSRHPNYFFQWLGWLAYPLIAIDMSGGYGWGWLALAGPICMYVLLVYVSGIPPLEAHMLRSRGDAYRDYQGRTSAFFPLPPTTGAQKSDEHRRSSHQGI
jgi:steroid 5-alpha reductase family enzyme